MMTPHNVAMYLRKSRADEEKETIGKYETLKHHEQILTEYADKHGLHIVKTYRELASGDSIASRPEMLQLLSDVDAGLYDGVLVTELSRLARGNTADQSIVSDTFSRTKTLIITPSKTYDPTNDADDTYIDFELFMARQEYKYIKKRMLAGRVRSALDGNWIRSIPIFGYEIKDLRLVPSENAEIAKKVLEDFANGRKGKRELVEYLQAFEGAPRYYESITYWLKNPAHYGYIDVKTPDGIRRVKAKWDGLIDEETHLKIVERMATKSARRKKHTRLRNPYSGILCCAKCGRMMDMVQKQTAHGMVLRLRHRNICQIQHDIQCEGVSSIRLPEMNKLIADALEENLPYIEEHITDEPQKIDVEPLKKKLKSLESRKRLLYDLLEDGTYTPEEFRDRRAKLDEDMKAITNQIDTATQIPQRPPIDFVVSTKDAINSLRDPNANAQAINDFLKAIIERIDYDRKSQADEPIIVITPRQ